LILPGGAGFLLQWRCDSGVSRLGRGKVNNYRLIRAVG
jgi:hypothetical protein